MYFNIEYKYDDEPNSTPTHYMKCYGKDRLDAMKRFADDARAVKCPLSIFTCFEWEEENPY